MKRRRVKASTGGLVTMVAQLWVLGIALTDIWNSGCAERLTSKLGYEEIFDAMRARFWKHNGMNVLVYVASIGFTTTSTVRCFVN